MGRLLLFFGTLILLTALCGGTAAVAAPVLAPIPALAVEMLSHDCRGVMPAPKSEVIRDAADHWLDKGDALSDAGKLPEALQAYTKAIETEPDYSDAYYSRALAYDDLGDVENAMKDYQKTIALNPNDACAHNNLAIDQQTIGETDQALAHFNEAITLDPKLATAYANRGDLYQELGHTAMAIEDYNSAIRLEPTNQDFRAGLAKIMESR